MDEILWTLTLYWLVGSVARGVNRYDDDLDYSRNRGSAILHGVGWALVWPVVDAVEAFRALK
jgi:hypothetical protein